MWFLEHESLFGGKRIWLRPGSQQLFGRTKPTEGDSSESKKVFIDNKNVSRKHMMIKVLEAPAECGTKLHTRSQVEVVDLSCRQGTTVDAQSIKSTKKADGSILYDKIILTEKEHSIKLSNSYPAFKIKWQDVVFTTAVKEKRENTAAVSRTAQLHAMDIKTSAEFIYGKTTHVVAQKRNLPKVLQGLVSGTPIVTTGFLDAVLNAVAHSVDADDNHVPSQLEEDFDTWWPKEKDYIPPAGAEPVARPENMLEPDPTRCEVFSGLTFVFLEENQHANLHQVVAGGGGKALLFDIHLGETTVEEYVEYVNSVVGKKKRGSMNKSALPVVTVRLSVYPDELADWATNFVNIVDRSLHQRSILQNEFLDAIVTKDRSQLQRPPTEIEEVDSNIAPATQSQRATRGTTPAASQSRAPSQVPESASAPSEEPPKTIPRKRPIRRGPTARFTGFDDYEPPTKARKVEEDTVMEEGPSQDVPAAQTQNLRNGRSQEDTQTAPSNPDRPKQMIDLFPAAAAMKRQREATRAPSASVEPEAAPASVQMPKRIEIVERLQRTKTKMAGKDINVLGEAKKHREEQEEKRRLEEESLRAALDGVVISDIRARIQFEEMKLRPREERPDQKSQAKSNRWDPAWDDRKNFKRFRRRGLDRGPQSQRVLVTFEEAPQKNGAVTIESFESPLRTNDDKRGHKRLSGAVADSESEPEAGFSRKKRAKTSDVVHVEDSGSDDGEDPVLSTRGSGRTQRVAETQLEDTQTQGSGRGKKRGAVSVATGQPSGKKGRFASSRRDDSDSDAEETGFRFRKRG